MQYAEQWPVSINMQMLTDRCDFFAQENVYKGQSTLPTIVTLAWWMALIILFCLPVFSHFPIINMRSLCVWKNLAPASARESCCRLQSALTVYGLYCPAFVNFQCVPQIQRWGLHTTTLTCQSRSMRSWMLTPEAGMLWSAKPMRRALSPGITVPSSHGSSLLLPLALVTSRWPHFQVPWPALGSSPLGGQF